MREREGVREKEEGKWRKGGSGGESYICFVYAYIHVDLQRVHHFIRTVNMVHIVKTGIEKYRVEVCHCFHGA